MSHPLALSGASLVITDIKLRGMNGIELFEKLRLLASPPPPILFISGHADENMQRYALSTGAAAFCVSRLTSIFCWIIFSGS